MPQLTGQACYFDFQVHPWNVKEEKKYRALILVFLQFAKFVPTIALLEKESCLYDPVMHRALYFKVQIPFQEDY